MSFRSSERLSLGRPGVGACSLILAIARQKQENLCVFKTSLIPIVNARPVNQPLALQEHAHTYTQHHTYEYTNNKCVHRYTTLNPIKWKIMLLIFYYYTRKRPVFSCSIHWYFATTSTTLGLAWLGTWEMKKWRTSLQKLLGSGGPVLWWRCSSKLEFQWGEGPWTSVKVGLCRDQCQALVMWEEKAVVNISVLVLDFWTGRKPCPSSERDLGEAFSFPSLWGNGILDTPCKHPVDPYHLFHVYFSFLSLSVL